MNTNLLNKILSDNKTEAKAEFDKMLYSKAAAGLSQIKSEIAKSSFGPKND